ncbi:MAG: ComEC/Rec2 family competence protein, partial [Rhodothermales bacterium]
MRRAPLAGIAVFFISGIIAGNALSYNPAHFLLILFCCCAFLFLMPIIWMYQNRQSLSLTPLFTFCLFGGAVFGAGCLGFLSTNLHPGHHVTSLDHAAAEYIMLGEIQTPPATTTYAHRFVINAERVYVQDTIKSVGGLIQVNLERSDSHILRGNVSPGQMVLLRGRLERPRAPRNPGAFDYRSYLRRKGITRILDAEEIHVLGPGHSITSRALHLRYAFQQTIQSSINNHVQHTEARSILYALILGNQSDISQSTKLNFQQTGLTHLLAVSGLHVMLVGFIVYHLLLPFCLRLGFSWRQTERIRGLATIIILCIYMTVTDFKAPVVRASIMAFLMIAGAIFQRPSSSINTMGAAALLLLIYQPTQLFDVGFQLSFAAVLSILILVNPLTSLIPASWMKHFMVRFCLQSMLVSVSATLGTLPILVYHFGFISLAGILLNIVALPLTAAALGAGLLMVLSASLSSSL